MNIMEMTVEQFRKIPARTNTWNTETECNSIVLLPAGPEIELHDSGYRLIDVVACKDYKPICRTGMCSDVLHLNGIGGLGKYDTWPDKGVPKTVPPTDWRIDCLPASGLLHMFIPAHTITVGTALSSLDLYRGDKKAAKGKEEDT